MERREVRWERMFPDELEEAMDECPLVFFAYGLCEPHGPQNAVGLDALKAHAIACAAAREHGGIVAPLDYWHVHEHTGYATWSFHNVGEKRPWLTAVPAWHHFKSVCYQVRAADALGFHAAILLTGHYGPNWQDLKTVVSILQPHFRMRMYGLPDWEANRPGFDGDGRSGGDHAGKVETSLLWSLEPDCVDVSRLPPMDEAGKHFAMGKNVYESDRRTGDRMVRDEVRMLGEKAGELLAGYEGSEDRTPLTFMDIEEIWEREIAPRLPDFESLKMFHEDKDPPPPESIWYAQWKDGYRKK